MQSPSVSQNSVNPSEENTRQFLDSLKAILQPYWYPTESNGRVFSEVIKSWVMLFFLLLLIIGLVGFTSFNSFVLRELLDAIQAKNMADFRMSLSIYGGSLLTITLLTGLSKFVRKKIALNWYEWLNDYSFQKYFSDRAYYKINFNPIVDNPDQRLSQEIEPIARTTLSFFATSFQRILEMIVFSVILWQISMSVGIILIIYTVIGNLIALYLSQELNKITEEELELEANYSYAVTHIRNHAESIAFFRGEKEELNRIKNKFRLILKNSLQKINWERNKEFFERAYEAMIQIFPYLIVAPLYIQGEIDFGKVSQASFLSIYFADALATLIKEFAESGKVSNYIDRLVSLTEGLELVSQQSEDKSVIKTREENRISFKNVTLETPNYQKVIVKDLNLEVEPKKGLLIIGPSGRGKSSLLRAIAGLWSAGTGTVIRPQPDDILFLPQRPYIILGTLREQLVYPNLNREVSTEELEKVLKKVNLGDVLTRVGSFDEEVNWENILSLGEQQRLAFARILVSHPHFIILDEATSALDINNEDNLYQQLENSKTTFISVGHRESLFQYHQSVLELSQDSDWKLMTVEDYQLQKNRI
ncbi:MAG TPA: ABC transporter [Planktothrix sp. UBA8407]|jgi:ABC-type uncharacterized transport system, permease and ATPase components|nr:ABC transporter [Planktothrix sp. UBA8402]HAO10857.1 ABC transporter [Planktothrix sp. UBA8407]HBK24399.1 ABC transporter [Planktothrix sp. UBA10369]